MSNPNTKDDFLDEDPRGPDIYQCAEHVPIPEDAWEYHIRKANNDAAYNTLAYKPYCSTMPVQKTCDKPKFLWTKKQK